MDNPKPKKLSFAILQILRDHTDADPKHRLNQNDIIKILRSEYGIKADRSTVRRNLTSLWEMGFPIESEATLRMYPNKKTGELEESYIPHSFYYDRDPKQDFDDSELRLLIDSLLFSKHVPYNQCKKLVDKLKGLSNKWFKDRTRFISKLPETMPESTELFYTIDILDEAIADKKQVTFRYNDYGADKKLHPRQTADGKAREYVVNPYQMAATNGRYYLICNYDNHKEVAHCRLDRITNIQLLDAPRKPENEVVGLKDWSLQKHMSEHLYMFGGESVRASFRIKNKKKIMNDVIDWFGTNIVFTDETEDEVTAHVTVNWDAMRHWALQYCRHVCILAPSDLAEHVQQDLADALARYESSKD